jgi:hypothetical protein
MVWILVLNPPLLRPIAWFSPSFLGAGAVLARPHNGAVDHGACPVSVKHRLDKQPIVPGGHTDVPFATRHKVSYTLPLIITKGVAAGSVNSESN